MGCDVSGFTFKCIPSLLRCSLDSRLRLHVARVLPESDKMQREHKFEHAVRPPSARSRAARARRY